MANTTIGLGQGLSLNNAIEGFDLLTSGSGTFVPDYNNQKCLVFVIGGGGGATGEGAGATSGSSGLNTTFGTITALGGVTTGANFGVGPHWYSTNGSESPYQLQGIYQPTSGAGSHQRNIIPGIPFGLFGSGGSPGMGGTPSGAMGPTGEMRCEMMTIGIAGVSFSIGTGGAAGTGTFANKGSSPGHDGAVFIYKIKPYSS